MAGTRKRLADDPEDMIGDAFKMIRALEARARREDPDMAAGMYRLARELDAAVDRVIASYRKDQYNGDDHVCLVYDGPPCKTCGKPTLAAQIGAPGYGTVRSCRDGHSEELTPCGTFTPEDVI